jgi:hypothetical protein
MSSTSTSTSAPVAASPAAEMTPVSTQDPKQKAQLAQLENFFDQNPAIEKALRQNIDRGNDAAFQQEYPAWKKFESQQPGVMVTLKAEDRFLLHRALVRMAGNSRLEMRSLRRLDHFLDEHGDIQAALAANPSLLFAADFQVKYPQFAQFLDINPDLSSAFYQNAGKKMAN